MSIKVALEHTTTYAFARPVAVAPHVIRLRPAPHSRTPIEAYTLEIEPKSHFLNWQQDPFGNWLARVVFPEKTERLSISVGLVADMMVVNPLDFFIEEYAERFPFAYEPQLKADLAPYLREVAGADETDAWRKQLPRLPREGRPTVHFLSDLNTAVQGAVGYTVRMEPGVQLPDHTLQSSTGSCRDSAWLLVALLRQYGLAARFVSGYLIQLAADQESLDGPSGPQQDFTDLHAWSEVFIPGAGWVGLDPTSALFAGEGHIPLSATPHPSSAAPITGATDPVEVTFDFSNEVRRIHEDPRVTLPYTEAAWNRIDKLGRAVDRRLKKGDVRLTMGGEPTFVALDDQTSAEWNTDADGSDKRRLANDLAASLQDAYAKGGVVHRGQGKWYPGEPLPRWNIALQWRADGTPLWQDPSLFGDPWAVVPTTPEPAPVPTVAVASRIAAILGLPPTQVLAAYEDPLADLVARVAQPQGPAPDEVVDGDILDRAVIEPSGWVIPINTAAGEWTSAQWSFRRGRLVLTPGTSAVGLRLPLESISWVPPDEQGEPSYLKAGPPLDPSIPEVTVISPEGAATTALAIEARHGLVHVFLPPTDRLEDYVALLRVIERAVNEADTQVVLEGYGPPPDVRLKQIVVTPDPGVIEVNVQPTRTWPELVNLTTTLYDQARQTRLSTEKFDLDGLHTGTGGGNHLTLGGPTPLDSPLLRRPQLLAGLVAYWQRHPSLSYLFSGRFIGPTSQAPRFDEGRPEATYEMEIALAEIDRIVAEDEEPRPWLVDRSLRHLLTDLTGNTHRSEFCIDKLYSPGSSRGRLGLLELRGFEMPPHPQMALLQALLVRGLVAMFWDRPHRDRLMRWGTSLHGDFLLPHGCRQDLGAVIADLRAAGFAFEVSWFDSFFEFRFPRIGFTRVAGMALELRQGIEPWNVLGEEASAGGTARYVDSSVERIEVAICDFDPTRSLVAVNGVQLPLKPTEVPGTYVGGIRFKAWSPSSSLHPSIPVQSPVVVEVIDVESALSLGGATYHVVHPGGRAYATPPVNASEAEARRASRFAPRGHTPGPIDVAALVDRGRAASSVEYPHILDLRRAMPHR